MGIFKWFSSSEAKDRSFKEEAAHKEGLYGKLKRSAESLFAASTQQSAAIQQAIASMTQMRAMLGQTNDQVQNSLKMTEKTSSLGEGGANNGELLKRAMDGIVDANDRLEEMRETFVTIQKRTRVIHDIVFKTQLLSLNASIEASRAGQFGKGFAVVAEEVGRLAQTSGRAAKEIDQLLIESQESVGQVVDFLGARVKEGMSASEAVRKSFGEISAGIVEVSRSLMRVSEASREQLLGIEQSSRAMEQMNSATEDNRRNAEQIYDIAHRVHADGMQSFNLDELDSTEKSNEVSLQLIANNKIEDVAIPRSRSEAVEESDIGNVSADDPTFKNQV